MQILTPIIVPPGLEQAFARELREKAATGVLVVSIIGFILFPSFAILDWIMYPERIAELSLARFSTSAAGFLFLGVQFYARRRQVAARYARVFSWVFIALCSAGLDIIIFYAGGVESPYYAGMILLLIAVIAGLPWGVLEMALMLLVIVAQFNVFMLAVLPIESWQLVVNSNFFMVSTIAIGLFGAAAGHRLRLREFLGRREVEEEKQRSEELLLNILPTEVADELKANGRVEARYIESCTILFSDFVGFTAMSERVDPERLVKSLDLAFRVFDGIMTERGLEKLKTVGDAYMCAGGVLDSDPHHLVNCVLTGLQMIDALERGELQRPDGEPWTMRVGIHSGPVVAGVIGDKKFTYDLWGDTVNTASRMESTARPHTVNMLAEVYEQVSEFYVGEDRGFIPVRGKGPLAMTQVHRLRPEYSADERGRVPNDAFHEAVSRWIHEPASLERPAPALRSVRLANRARPSDVLSTLSVLREEDLDRLDRVADLLEIPEGRVLIEEGQELDVLFLVTEGLLGVRMARDGVDIELAVLGPGEIVGELSFLSLGPASATVVALTDAVVRRFDLKGVQKGDSDNPGFSARLFHSFALVLARRVREANARMFSMGDRPRPGSVSPVVSLASPAAVPESVAAAMRDLQRLLHPYADGWAHDHIEPTDDPSVSDPSGAVAAVVALACEGLVVAFDELRVEDPERLPVVGGVVLRECYRFLMRSELLSRCLHNAEGCASDHAALESIVNDRAMSAEPLGRMLDRWFLGEPVARALQAGVQRVSEELDARLAGETGRIRITSLSSCSAPEVFSAMAASPWSSRIQITCVDPDVDDLAAIGRRAAEFDRERQFTFVALDVMLSRHHRPALQLAPQHLVLVPRLVADLDDEALLALLNEIHSILTPGGVLLLGQIHVPAAFRAFLEHILMWPTGDRTPAQLAPLVERSRFGAGTIDVLEPDIDGFSLVALRRTER
jgi:class 3 adenylate cyclase/CRP-like cAMP-binding protein